MAGENFETVKLSAIEAEVALEQELSDADLAQVAGGGLVDGSLNNLHVSNNIELLNATINSQVQVSE